MLCSGLVGADPLAKRVLFEFILTGLRVDRQPVLPPLAAVHDHIICILIRAFTNFENWSLQKFIIR
jgi:hypothetical protein